MRLNKYMAMCGVASRRNCDEIIAEGRVRVNARIVKKLGTLINPESDIVVVDDKPIRLKGPFTYYMLNKPVKTVTTVSDPRGRKTVMDLVPDNAKRLYPVGRLDYNTGGLLLITNDGDTAQKLMHPSFEFGKTYIVTVNGQISEDKIEELRTGVDIGGFVTSPAKVSLIKDKGTESELKITIYEGKNRQIRRMFETVGKKVIKLQRVAIGKLKLGYLAPGECRELTREEIDYLLTL